MAFSVLTSQEAGWDEARWDAFVEGHPRGHFLQFSGWGALKEAFGWEALRVGLLEDGRLVAGAQVLFRPLPGLGRMGLRFAYIPKGPLVAWEDEAQARALLDAVHGVVRARGGLLLRVEPELRDTPEHRAWLQRYGLNPSARWIQPRTTVWVDISPAEEVILARMKQKWRYNIRLAGRKGVVVREGGEEDVERFIALMQITGDRKAFGVHAPEYYRAFWRIFAAQGRAVLLMAEYEGEALAGIMVGQCGPHAYYLYGASGNRHRNLMPSHLLQWEAMRWAKARGCTGYDLWGVPDEVGKDPDAPIPDPPQGMWGVWRFKRGFGGEIVRYVGAWDRAYYPLVGRIFQRV